LSLKMQNRVGSETGMHGAGSRSRALVFVGIVLSWNHMMKIAPRNIGTSDILTLVPQPNHLLNRLSMNIVGIFRAYLHVNLALDRTWKRALKKNNEEICTKIMY
jgi:hypothetical protein